MKVAVIYSGAKNGGGLDNYLFNLFGYDKKNELNLFSLGEWALTNRLNAAKKNLYLFSGARFNPITVVKMGKILRAEGYDLVVTGGVLSNAYGRAAGLFSGVPVLTIVHSDQEHDYPNPITRIIYRVIDRTTRWKTKSYITVSEYLKNQLIKSGVKSGKINVIYNGIPFKFQGSKKKEGKSLIIGSIGRLHKVKNFESLIIACGKLKDENWKLKIAGEGEHRKNLERLINEYGLNEKVQLLGYTDDIETFLSGLDIYVQPSFCEGFCLTAVEAMLAEKPVIVTPGGALPELAKGGAGVLAEGFGPEEIAKAIEKVVADKKLRAELGQKGKKLAEKRFEPTAWAAGTLAAFKEASK
jgi:glycosyltransferase involved in cell wall biosynthesis